ncbi:lipase [Streptomyces armeniacus]|uniref:Lipase n=1 Tax=Streptomyces armeniacus TaxID=83291 RepID=A0A345XWL7_9ACTN|nr:lipase [Streptomyces armeniacus]AXK36033.1 lipase [Streptomyces armeniacus]
MRSHKRLPHSRTRRALVAALVVGACAAAVPAVGLPGGPDGPGSGTGTGGTDSRADAASARPVRLSLARPTGPFGVGTTELHLVDETRRDPWGGEGRRELMASVWYPARHGSGGERAPYMRPGAAKVFGKGAAEVLKLPAGTVDWAGTRTHARLGAEVSPKAGRAPVVLFSPGGFNERTLGTSTAEQLASEGYVVVTIDHPGEAHAVEFPDGRVVEPSPELQKIKDQAQRWRRMLEVRVADTHFVTARLRSLAKGDNPDAGRRALPRGLAKAMDMEKLGMFGHSMGGVTAAEAMREDPGIDAGVDLDGPLGLSWTDPGKLLPVARTGLDRPFLLMGTKLFREDESVAPHTHRESPSWKSFWEHSPGWKRDLWWPKAAHNSLTDYQSLLPQLDRRAELPRGLRESMIGTVDPERSVSSQRAYLTAFFDRHLRGQSRPVLDGPSPRHPDVRFIR